MGLYLLGQEQTQMPMWIASFGPDRKMIGLLQGISTINSSRALYDLSIMVNSSHKPSIRIVIQRRYAPSMHCMPCLIVFPGNGIHKSTSSTIRINFVRIWSGMGCGIYSPYHTLSIKIWSGNFFYSSLYYPCTIWNTNPIAFIKSLRPTRMWFKTWHAYECTWGALCK